MCPPVHSSNAEETESALRFYMGDQTVGQIYSDNAPSLISACDSLGINREGSTPFRHNTNAIIERFNQTWENGVRAALQGAGMPTRCWPLAGPCVTFWTMFATRPETDFLRRD